MEYDTINELAQAIFAEVTDVILHDEATTLLVNDIEESIDCSRGDFHFDFGDHTYRVIRDDYILSIYNEEVKDRFFEDNNIPAWVHIDWEKSLHDHYTNCRYSEWFGDSFEWKVGDYFIYRTR